MFNSKFLKDNELYNEFVEYRADLSEILSDFYYEKHEFNREQYDNDKKYRFAKDEIDGAMLAGTDYTFMISDSDDDSDNVVVYANKLLESDSLLFDDNVDKAYPKFFEFEVITSLIAELIVDNKLIEKILHIYKRSSFVDTELDECEKVATLVFSNDNTYELFAYQPILRSQELTAIDEFIKNTERDEH